MRLHVTIAGAFLSFLSANTVTRTAAAACDPVTGVDCGFIDTAGAYGLVSTTEVYGIAVGDFDHDNLDDLFVGRHMDLTAPVGFESPMLLRNQAGAGFSDDVACVYPAAPIDPRYFDIHVSAFGDYDADGLLDLAVVTGAVNGSGEGLDQLYWNNGATSACVGAPWQDEAPGLPIEDAHGSGRYGAWLDYDGDKDLDLFVGHVPWYDCGLGNIVADAGMGCPSTGNNNNKLFQNQTVPAVPAAAAWSDDAFNAGVQFEDTSGAALTLNLNVEDCNPLLNPGGPQCESDMDLVLTPKYARPSGETPDYVTFYINQHDGTFARHKCSLRPQDYVTVAAGDLNNDGRADLVFGRASDDPAEVWMHPPTPAATNPCSWPRVYLPAATSHATALVLADFDNDRDLDLYVGREDKIKNRPAAILVNQGGAFLNDPEANVNVWSGLKGRVQATWGDFDHDGWVDVAAGKDTTGTAGGNRFALLLNNYKTQAALSANQSVVLRFEDPTGIGSNRFGLGTRVAITCGQATTFRWIHGGGSWHTSQPHYAHAGVGDPELCTSVDVTAMWPDGVIQTYFSLTPGLCHTLFYDGTTGGC